MANRAHYSKNPLAGPRVVGQGSVSKPKKLAKPRLKPSVVRTRIRTAEGVGTI